jgi:hypothetical protein
MSVVIRMIWRLDHNYSYHMLDNYGRVLKEMYEGKEKLWNSAGPGSLPFSLLAEYKDSLHYRRISVEANNINGWMDWAKGIEINRIFYSDEMLEVTRIISAILEIGQIRLFNRVGIRFISLGAGRRQWRAENWSRACLSAPVSALVRRELGPLDDVGVTLEGQGDDKLSYRVTLGPTARRNITANLSVQPSEEAIVELENFAMFFDVDLYESAIGFGGQSFAKWASTKVEKAQRFVDEWSSVDPAS